MWWSPYEPDFFGKDNFDEVLFLKRDGTECQHGKCLCVHEKAVIFSTAYVGRSENGWKEAEHGTHLGKFAEKYIDLEDPTPLIHQVCLGCTQREAKIDPSSGPGRNRVVHNVNNNKGSLTKKRDERKIIRWKRSLLGALMWKVIPEIELRNAAN